MSEDSFAALISLLFVFAFAIIMYAEGSAPPSLQTNFEPLPRYNEKKEKSNLISKTQKVEKIMNKVTCPVSVQERRAKFKLIHSPIKKPKKQKYSPEALEKTVADIRSESEARYQQQELEEALKQKQANEERERIIASYTIEDIQRVQDRRSSFKLVYSSN